MLEQKIIEMLMQLKENQGVVDTQQGVMCSPRVNSSASSNVVMCASL